MVKMVLYFKISKIHMLNYRNSNKYNDTLIVVMIKDLNKNNRVGL